jgi:hypothetical protein
VEITSRAFSQIYEQHKPGALGWGASEHLRGDLAGTKLYTHSAFSISGSGEAAAKGRQDKWAAGAAYVKNAIDQEFGPGMGDRVFKKISSEGGPNLDKELLRGDLGRIRATIDEIVSGPKPELDRAREGLGERTPTASTPLKARLSENHVGQAEVFGLAEGREPGTVTRTEATEKRLVAMFGRSLSDAEIRGLGGMPESCDVQLDLVGTNEFEHRNPNPDLHGVMISMSRQDASGAFKAIQMTVYQDREGKVNLYRDKTRTETGGELDNEKPRPKNIGACALVKQVDTARSLGISTIHNFSAQGKGYNGYYTWARYGGNAPLTGELRAQLRPDDRGAYDKCMSALRESPDRDLSQLAAKRDLDVQDLMATAKGREFWMTNGFPIPLEFNLDPGSKTMRMFAEYTVPSSCFDLRPRGH